MPNVKLSLSVPEDTWIGAVSRAYPAVDFRVLTAMVRDGTGYAVLEVGVESPLGVLSDIEDRAALHRVDLISTAPERTIVHIETAETSLLDPLATAGIPLETPIDIEDGTVVWTFTTPEDRLSTLDARLQAAGLDFEVEYVRTGTAPAGVAGPELTDRQAEVFETAHRMGFFEIPRESTVQAVADEAGVSKSTASDVLRRAIRNLAEWYTPEAGATRGR
jgi:hypothetical protein